MGIYAAALTLTNWIMRCLKLFVNLAGIHLASMTTKGIRRRLSMTVTACNNPSMRSSHGCDASGILNQYLTYTVICSLTSFNASKGIPERHLSDDIESDIDKPLGHIDACIIIPQFPELIHENVYVILHYGLLLS